MKITYKSDTIRVLSVVVCIISSLCLCSFAWRTPVAGWGIALHQKAIRASCHAQQGAGHMLRLAPPGSSPKESREILDSRNPPSGSAEGVARNSEQAEEPSEEAPSENGSIKEQQPWWEDERRTEGVPTLTSSTQWRMTLSLKDPALKGDTGEVTDIAVRVRFNEDSGFEPPQGSLDVIEDNPYFVQQARKARWTLSEGEETRSAGLWIWGLFNEPLYPYLLLQMQNLEIDLRSGAKIAPGTLYVKADHRRDEKLGPTLKSGTVGIRLVERVRVDPLGMAEADITNVVPCGTVRFRPV